MRIASFTLLGFAGILMLGSGLVLFTVLSRPRLSAIPSTTHPSLSRQECVDCHAPIAEEWRQSFHYKSLTGPYWKDVRELGYLRILEMARKPCLNCHAPANVLDLREASGGAGAPGVECAPNLFRNPQGTIPSARADDVELGVDCTACHVSKRGVTGSGRRLNGVHETIADPRFLDPAVASRSLCGRCHASTVAAWGRTALAATGTTCLECHMPEMRGPTVGGGAERTRRSHRFLADKDPTTLREAVNATLDITPDRQAVLRLQNERVGHHLPSGGNWLSVRLDACDTTGRSLGHGIHLLGREEGLVPKEPPRSRRPCDIMIG